MNSLDFNNHLEKIIKRTEEVLRKKGVEYSSSENVFHTFEEGKNFSLHNTNVGVGWEFGCKHFQSVKDIINKIEHDNFSNITEEFVNEKFGDSINYLILLEVMIKEKIKINENK